MPLLTLRERLQSTAMFANKVFSQEWPGKLRSWHKFKSGDPRHERTDEFFRTWETCVQSLADSERACTNCRVLLRARVVSLWCLRARDQLGGLDTTRARTSIR